MGQAGLRKIYDLRQEGRIDGPYTLRQMDRFEEAIGRVLRSKGLI